jgi:hypothetical protein
MQMTPPLTWGDSVDGQLAAANNGVPGGLASLGVKSTQTIVKSAVAPIFGNPAFWRELLGAPADQKFRLLAVPTSL